MSKINDLIKELCPNGVKKYTIKDICLVTRGRVISKMELQENIGEYPVYSSQTLNNGVFGKINTYDFEGQYVQWTTDGANAGSIFYRNGKFSVTNVCGLLKVKDEYFNAINTNYLSYALTMESKKYVNYATSNPKLMSNVMERITVLIPPIEIQEEIVRILDKFGELEAELEARKSQYEFWCGKLLNKKNNNYKKYNITEICKSISAGGDVPEDTIKGISKPQDDYKYPVISNGVGENAIYGYSKNYRVDVQSCVTIAARGTIGYHEVRYGKFTPIIRLITLIPDEKVISAKYLHYALYRHEFKSSGGSIPQLTTPTVKQLDLIIPPIEEQNRIVGILDKFDKLVNDITDGLPAEIELRRKQYEYYRNKLLNFEGI